MATLRLIFQILSATLTNLSIEAQRDLALPKVDEG